MVPGSAAGEGWCSELVVCPAAAQWPSSSEQERVQAPARHQPPKEWGQVREQSGPQFPCSHRGGGIGVQHKLTRAARLSISCIQCSDRSCSSSHTTTQLPQKLYCLPNNSIKIAPKGTKAPNIVDRSISVNKRFITVDEF